MNRLFFILIGMLLITTTASAELQSTLKAKLVVPRGSDPARFDFTSSNQTIEVTGQDLLSGSLGGNGGADLNVADSKPLLRINQLSFTNTTAFNIQFDAPVSDLPSFDPWNASKLLLKPNETVFFNAGPNSANIGDIGTFAATHRIAALFEIYDLDDLSPEDFRSQKFLINGTGYSLPVPEAGTLSFAIALLVSGTLLIRRRHSK